MNEQKATLTEKEECIKHSAQLHTTVLSIKYTTQDWYLYPRVFEKVTTKRTSHFQIVQTLNINNTDYNVQHIW